VGVLLVDEKVWRPLNPEPGVGDRQQDADEFNDPPGRLWDAGK
jgi:hypothetical protein